VTRGRGKNTHLPKKKHANRPRAAPVVPLSELERGIKAQQEFEKAMIHLIEAERIAKWGSAPNACVHSAYYAMHHCASAAILAAGGVGKRPTCLRVMSMSFSTMEIWLHPSRAF
jgi:hypothetical protein